jgi:hypothetical protein
MTVAKATAIVSAVKKMDAEASGKTLFFEELH